MDKRSKLSDIKTKLRKKDELLDMSNATEGWTWARKRREEMANK